MKIYQICLMREAGHRLPNLNINGGFVSEDGDLINVPFSHQIQGDDLEIYSKSGVWDGKGKFIRKIKMIDYINVKLTA